MPIYTIPPLVTWCCSFNVQVIPKGPAGSRTSAVSHSVPLSRTGDVIRPEAASKDGLVSSRNGPTLAEDSTASAHAQEGADTTEAEMREPQRAVVRDHRGGRGWSGDETKAREAARRNRGVSTETHIENTVQGAVLTLLLNKCVTIQLQIFLYFSY